MGLDTSHGCWNGSYSSFSRWRNAVAVAAGYSLCKIDYAGAFGAFQIETVDLNNCQFGEMAAYGEWSEPPSDVLLVLLVHSDCEGEIKPEHCTPLADRLEGLLPTIEANAGGRSLCWDAENTRRFIAGLRLAASFGEPVKFH